MSVSVVVVHYRQQRQLDRTLAALARQTHPADALEVIVADDGSPEAPTVPDGVKLLRQPDLGERPGAARNLGARHATGEVLCFLDADTAPEPEYVATLARGPARQPKAVCVGRRRHADYATDPPTVLEEPGWLARGYEETANLSKTDDRSYRFVISSVLACSRAFFAQVGGFAEAPAYGGEDWEWAYRAWLRGAVLHYEPDAIAWHDGPDWGGRDAGQAVKNAETLRLAEAISVPGSRGHGLRSRVPDVAVTLASAPSPAAAFICVDSLLAVVPEAVVAAPGLEVSDPRVVDEAPFARVAIELPAPVRVRGRQLRAVVDDLRGTVELGDGPLMRLTHARGGDVVRRPAPWLEAVEDEPDLEAYLGGWDV